VYEVKVVTGDRRGAGTDATVTIVLYGENGDSGKPKVLQNASNNFERGNSIIFSLYLLIKLLKHQRMFSE
jgi:hypothetical protein